MITARLFLFFFVSMETDVQMKADRVRMAPRRSGLGVHFTPPLRSLVLSFMFNTFTPLW